MQNNPPGGFHFLKTKLRIVLFLPLLFLTLGFAGCGKSDSAPVTSAAAPKYHCPMHPTYTSDKPGDCPICNMSLTLIKEEKPAAEKPAPPKATRYHCPMHPTYTSDKPGDCPICNMSLTPIKEDSDQSPSDAPAVSGRTAVFISPDKQQLIGLTTATVEKRELSMPVRATATLEHDETRMARIAPRFSGWIRDLNVNFTGQEVKKGEPLLTVYSPDLLSAETEYLLAFERLKQLKDKADGTLVDQARLLAESARRKLALWEIGEQEIKALEASGKPGEELLLRSPVSGHVLTKTAVAGKAFMAGETLYEIADLSHLWLRASVSEFEAPLIKLGQKAKVTLPYLGNKTVSSEVTFLYPHIDPQTRRAEIRLEVDNPERKLRPQMWASVEINVSLGEVLAIPADAVIDTGTRHIAFVKRQDNHLEPRELKIGSKTDQYYQVIDGVEEGEKVVSRALFLVDSESQLKAAISGMGAGEHHHQ